jgi:hypothetical protein
LNASLDSDPLSRVKVSDGSLVQRTGDDRDFNFYINANGQKSNTVDGYKYNANTYGLGFEKKINSSTMLGVQYNRVDSTLDGSQGGGNLTKDAFGIYGITTVKDFIIKGDVGYSSNKYNTNHNLVELGLNNNSSANGNDKWAAVRGYTPEFKGFRPYIGARVENNQRGSTVDTGSEVSSVSYNSLNSTKSTAEAGLRYEKALADKWTAVAEAGRNTAQLNTYTASVIYAAKDNSSIVAKVTRQEQNGVDANQAMILGRINF